MNINWILTFLNFSECIRAGLLYLGHGNFSFLFLNLPFSTRHV